MWIGLGMVYMGWFALVGFMVWHVSPWMALCLLATPKLKITKGDDDG